MDGSAHPVVRCCDDARFYNRTRHGSCALRATITVLRDINTAPTAAGNTMPHDASTLAASGIATML
jgi:hypothetical protein